jgi:deoxycytidylate deaminase
MQVADTIGSRSKCSRAKVGVVVVDQNQSVLAASYNGPPPGLDVDGWCTGWCDRAKSGPSDSYDNCPANHAEINAITRMPASEGATVYINRMCCFTCAKALASAKVSRVVCKYTDLDGHIDDTKIIEFLTACGVRLDRAV